ncbi:MAG TPA: DUF885 domain-containing protein [Candidatus Binatia bacterium]|nr:DUF885 domain-containing protein [Candidatus Binatia bacterium]
MSEIRTRLGRLLDELFRLDPVRATDAGDHRFDDRWPDRSPAGREAVLAAVDRWLAELGPIDSDRLDPEDALDIAVARGELEAIRFAEAELRPGAWNALEWVELAGAGLFLLLARDFAPLADRLASLAGRLEKLPALFAAARDELEGTPERPPSRLHLEAAIDQLPGVAALVEEALAAAESAARAGDGGAAALLPRLRAAADVGRRAIDGFGEHLERVVRPASEGEGRLGPEAYRALFRHTIRDPALDPEAMVARAEREAAAIRAEMVRLARALWPRSCPDRPLPTPGTDGIATEAAAEAATVRGVLDAVSAEHPSADGLLEACRAALARVEAFVAERRILDLPDEPLAIEWTPPFLRAFGGASLWSPGPLDRGQRSLFLVTPVPDDWSAEERESWLRELNDRQITLLVVHEGVPGHYLQGVWANRCPSLVRSVLASGVYAEGWAVYVTQLMIDEGLAAADPALELVHWKFYLRSVLNALLDVGVHTRGLDEARALALLVEGGFQEPAEARNKYRRARLTAGQLSTYFVGSLACWELEARAREAAARGLGLAGPVARDLPGGLVGPDGFDRRAFLERVLSVGAPPPALLRDRWPAGVG